MDTWAHLARTHCPECGSTDLEWMPAIDLPWRVQLSDRIRVFRLIEFCGPGAQAWVCNGCNLSGIWDHIHAA